MAKLHEGGDVHVNYMLMPLTAEETIAGGECLGRRYAIAHKDRWVDINNLIFSLQTYDRGYTMIHINGRTYSIHQDIIDVDATVRLYIGRYVGTSREDDIGGIETVGMNPKKLYTWKELVDLGVVTDTPSVNIDYTKLFDEKGSCLIGNVSTGGVQLVIPPKTISGADITSVSTDTAESEWEKPNFPAKYICKVILSTGLTTIGGGTSAFPMLGRNVTRYKVEVGIPSTVMEIGSKAFYGSKIEILSGSKPYKFTIEDKLETIADSAFENCTELAVVHFSPNLKTVKAKAFANCKKAKICFRNNITNVAEDACFLVGDVEYTPRITEGKPVPEIVSKAPFKAKLWNGKTGYAPGFYKKPERPPYTPPILPGGGTGTTDPDRTPLDLSGVINQINGLDTVANDISTP